MFKVVLLLGAVFVAFCAHAQATDIVAPGQIFELQGNHSELGKYHGQLELRPGSAGRVEIVRLIDFDTFHFDGLKVQQIWSGSGFVTNGNLTADFRIKRADILRTVDAEKRRKAQFERPLLLRYSVNLGSGTSRSITPDGVAEEQLSSPKKSGEKPIWKDERRSDLSKGDSFVIVGNYANSTIFLPAILKYRNSGLLAKWAQRPEFLSQNHYFVFDPTDFDFLRQNKNYLRVENKVLDKISLVEAEMRHDAYSYTLENKAKIFDSEMQETYTNELGLFCAAFFDASGRRVADLPSGDGALWSGMYAGSQAMRWLVTKDPQALANYKRTTAGLMLLMDLPGDPREFARTAELFKPMVPAKTEPWRQSNYNNQKINWCYGGNNDMIKGLFHAFVWGFEILPEGDPFREKLKLYAKRLSGLRISGEWKHPGNRFTANGFAALASGSDEDLDRYLQNYQLVMAPADYFNVDKGYYYGGIADWSGVNLNMVSSVSDILVAKNLLKTTAARSPGRRVQLEKIVANLRLKLLNVWSIYSSCRRDFVTIAANTFGATNSQLLDFPENTTPVTWTKKGVWEKSLDRSIWGLREIAVLRHNHEISFDYKYKPEWCASAWPRLPWKIYTDENPSVEYHFQSAYNFPYFEGSGDDDCLWTSAMNYRGGSHPSFRHGRMDFLHAYWMGRLSGQIKTGS